MAPDEYSTEMELYGVSPTIMAYIMLMITLVVPFGYISEHFPLPEMIYSFLWQIAIGRYGFYPRILSLGLIQSLFPLTVLNWAYAYWIVRYYQAKSSRFTVIMIGFLGLLLPFFGSIFYSTIMGGPYLQIVYPIPIQFIAGLIMLRRVEGPEVISPWSGVRLDFSWWKWKRVSRTMIEESSETEKETPTEEDWLEG
jgi:hypothetical protein